MHNINFEKNSIVIIELYNCSTSLHAYTFDKAKLGYSKRKPLHVYKEYVGVIGVSLYDSCHPNVQFLTTNWQHKTNPKVSVKLIF